MFGRRKNKEFQDEPIRITKELLVQLCKEHKLYTVPSQNDVLYLHFKGFPKIEHLEEYTGLKCLWLENNCISQISGLENQTALVSLYLHHNALTKIENLDVSPMLCTVNLSYNFIRKIENLSVLPVLSSLFITHNKLSTADDIAHLMECKSLSIVDLSHNILDDPEIVQVFAKMESLRVLTLTGNDVISKIKNYRKTLILKCKHLCHLDERPVFQKDRACAEAWSTGGIEAEQAMRTKLIEEEQARINDSVNALLKLKVNKQNEDSRPSYSTTSGQEGSGDSGHRETTNMISSKDYYSEYSDSESSDSSDDSRSSDGPLVCEIIKTDESQSQNERGEPFVNSSNNPIATAECRAIVESLVEKCLPREDFKVVSLADVLISEETQSAYYFGQEKTRCENVSGALEKEFSECNLIGTVDREIVECSADDRPNHLVGGLEKSNSNVTKETESDENPIKDDDRKDSTFLKCESDTCGYSGEMDKDGDISIRLPWQQSRPNDDHSIKITSTDQSSKRLANSGQYTKNEQDKCRPLIVEL
ncbi:dynein axonemal assembly factor 1-like [Adelges cooleyi]|uniref:dynein axonemal assembly factor 1-like n=1 Tax=Adelges cooleyi TaxID=133065 RepID=UPI00218033B0|nr:dynein axonemal assembly factor 1-like [Adelges cooleyi]